MHMQGHWRTFGFKGASVDSLVRGKPLPGFVEPFISERAQFVVLQVFPIRVLVLALDVHVFRKPA